MRWFPMHACPFESSLHDGFVGTFHHSRTKRPAFTLIPRIVHQRFPLAQMLQGLFQSLSSQSRSLQAGERIEQQARSPMFEQMQTPSQGIVRQGESSLRESVQDIAHALGRMGEISDPYRIRSMQIHQIL